jgi:hypothetical protein
MTLPMVFPGSPRVRRTDPVTSSEAADATEHTVWASHQAVLHILTHPMTALEVETAATGLPFSASRIRSALPELAELGFVVRDGFVRRDGDKRRRQLWRKAK